MRSFVCGACKLAAVLAVFATCWAGPISAGEVVELGADPGRPLVIAHRGASGIAPENTMASFEQAVKLGADLIELDVHGSKDGRVVVIHDASTHRTCRGKLQGAVADLTLEQLKALDAGAWKGAQFAGERIPTLDEVLASFGGRAVFLIELKARGIERKVAQVIRDSGMESSVMLQSFDAEPVRVIHSLLPEVPAGVLYRDTWVLDSAGRGRRIVEQVREVGASIAGMNVGAVSPGLVKALKDGGVGVFAWTADDDWIFRSLIDAGVDAIITNYPERLLQFLGRSAGE